VLRPGGIHRIVVPDFEELARGYLNDVARCEGNPEAQSQHDKWMDTLVEQSVRRRSAATWGLSPVKAALYTLIFGDARKRGETHQWLYDRFNLGCLLESAGLRVIAVRDCWSSGIPSWSEYGLDIDAAGAQYKPGSLYFEASK